MATSTLPILTYDQVDNRTSASTIYKPNYINRMSEEYHREDERLKTFAGWTLDWLDKKKLAQTGMFYTNEEDKVKCYFCEVEIGRWEREDEPVSEHLHWSPNCPLLRRRTTNNVPLNAEELERILPPRSYDICGSNDVMEHVANGLQSLNSTNSSVLMDSHSTSLVTNVCNNSSGSNGGSYFPEHPEFAIEAARQRSFGEWPRNMKQRPEQMAEAGFFYTGAGDRVRCFSCGGGLKDWDDNDDPWEQHALWLKHCRFLKLMKGQKWIDSVNATFEAAKAEESEKCSNAGEQLPATATVVTESVSVPTDCPTAKASTMLTPQSSYGSSSSVSSSNCDLMSSTVATAATPAVGIAANSSAVATRIYDKIVANAQDTTSATVTINGGGCGGGSSSSAIPEEKLCKICYACEYNTAFLPCGHVVACAKCASSVTKCPLCRKLFTDVMRVYFS